MALCMVAAARWAAADHHAPLRELTDQDIAAWSRVLGEPAVSPDGRWFVYLLSAYDDSSGRPRRGPPQLIVRSVRGASERRYTLGELPQEAAQLEMSKSGRWIAYAAAGDNGKPVVVVMELDSGSTQVVGPASAFRFVGSAAAESLLVQGQPEQGHYTLALYRAGSGERDAAVIHGKVTEFAVDAPSDRLAWVDEGGVHWRDLASGREETLVSENGGPFKTLRWSSRGTALAWFAGAGSASSIVIATHIGERSPRVARFDPAYWPGFPSGFQMTINPAGSGESPLGKQLLRWREEEDGLFFEIERVPSTAGSGVGSLVLWHSRDELLPGKRALNAVQSIRERLLCYASVAEGNFFQLAQGNFDTVIPQLRGRFALTYDWRSYGLSNQRPLTNGGRQRRNYALVELTTGRHRALIDALAVTVVPYQTAPAVDGSVLELTSPLSSGFVQPRLSPDGKYFVYLDRRGRYQSIDVSTGEQTEASRGASADSFSEDRNHFEEAPAALQGWSGDGRHMLASDGSDVWALSLNGGSARNLTGGGRQHGLRYSIERFASVSTPFIDTDAAANVVALDGPLFFKVQDSRSVKTGFARRVPSGRTADLLGWQDAMVDCLKPSPAAPYICKFTIALQGADYFVLDEHWQPGSRLTRLNPEQQRFQWPPRPLELRFTLRSGAASGAILYLPMGGRPGRSYPTIVKVYQRSLPMFHLWNTSPAGNEFEWLRAGFAVLCPDIRPRPDEPGPTALETVMAAVEAGVKAGYVDRDKLGLMGHSFGGYETNYIITQTQIFKAALSEAGLSDLVSFYNSTYAGISRAPMNDDGAQPFVPGPWWVRPEVYRLNSPLEHARGMRTPLLLLHGDHDTSVDFSQSVQFFNVLRYLNAAPVVLLQYVGASHGLDGLPDAKRRQLQFFDHFLKGAPAPAWWSENLSYYKGRVPPVLPAEAVAAEAPHILPSGSPLEVRVN